MSFVDDLRARKRALKSELDADLRRSELSGKAMTATERRSWDSRMEELTGVSERLDELAEQEARDNAGNAHRAMMAGGPNVNAGLAYTQSRDVYAPDNFRNSFFVDQWAAQRGDGEAQQRLSSNNASRGMESRAGDLVSVTATQGGVFAPPSWLVQEYVALARPGRVTADLMTKEVLPKGISSINLPKVSGGSGAGVQATQNSALTDTALTSTSVSSGITLIGGKQIISRQLLDQSPGGMFDRVILQDLAAEAAKQLDIQVISGSGSSGQLRGIASVAGGTTITYTTATPKVIDGTTNANSFFSQIVKAAATIATNRFRPAQVIVMTPNRWAWVLEAVDSQGRPLVTPNGPQYNGIGTQGNVLGEGAAGTLAGLPVYIDANIPQTWNSSTNQDGVFVLRTDDMLLLESEPEFQTFDATYADNFSILARSVQYAAFLPDRYAASVGVIQGTGLVAVSL